MRLEEFRHSVLALTMISERFASSASTLLQPRYFDNPAEQHLCRFILEHYKEYRKPPKKLAVRDRAYKYFNASKHLKDQLTEFDVLLDIVTDMDEAVAEQADYIQDRVVSFCREQAIKEALIKSVDFIQKGKLDVVVPEIQKAMQVGSETESPGIFLLRDADSRQTVSQTRDCIPCGHSFIDEPTKGGLARGELAIIMAPPNVGKTSVLVNIGVGIMKNRHKPGHFSLEMKQGFVRAKYDQCFLKRTDEELEALDDGGVKAIAAWMKKIQKQLSSDVYIKDFPAHRLTMEQLRAHIILLRHRYEFDMDALLLDYMDLMAMPTHIKEDHLQLTWMGVELRQLCVDQKLAGFTVSQTTRGGYSKETSKGDDVAGDFKKLATSDLLGSLNQTEKEQEEDKARFFLIKNRIGRKGRTYNLNTDYSRTLITPDD